MAVKKMRGPLKVHGGKGNIAHKIVPLFPRHLNYVEPYAGGLSVMLARDPMDEALFLPGHVGVSEVVNDLDRQLTNFWRVLQDEVLFANFHRIVQAVPFSGIEWCDANEESPMNHIQAVRFFIRCRMSLAGRMKAFTGLTKTRLRSGMSNEVSAWLGAVDGLPDVHARLRRVLILPPTPAVTVIRKFDSAETFYYLDPPYPSDTRTAPNVYKHEMTAGNHEELLDTLAKTRGRVMLSGYENAMYNDRLKDWRKVVIDVANSAAGGKSKRRMRECLWMNYPEGA